jgi:hypothetical protein
MRPVRQLTAGEAAKFAPEVASADARVVVNIRHRGQHFWGNLPRNGIASVIFQHKHGKGEGHALIRFKAKPGRPFVLRSQRGDQTMETENLVFQVHAAGPKEHTFSYQDAAKRRYQLVYEVATLESIVSENARDPHGYRQFELDLRGASPDALLDECLRIGTDAGLNETYDPIVRNCITEMFRPIDRVVDYGKKNPLFRESRARPMHPSNSRNYLARRGLIANELPGLEVEFGK